MQGQEWPLPSAVSAAVTLSPQRLQSEGARKGLCGAVVNEDHAEVAVATQRGVVAGPPDDRKRARCPARRRRRWGGLGMEKDRKCSAAVVAGERLSNRGHADQLTLAATDQLIHKCPRWTQWLGGGEGTERRPLLREDNVGRDRGLLGVCGW